MSAQHTPYVNDWGVPVRGYESALGGLYKNEDIALHVSDGVGPCHSLVRFVDVFEAFEALDHILKYDGDALGSIGFSLAKSALAKSRRGNVSSERASFTAGPWSQYRDDQLVIVNSDGSSLCEATSGDPYISYRTQLANARLIAAAPELLEALEMAVDQMVASAKDEARRRGYEYCEERCDAIVAARAAIAAAKGQA